MATRNSTSSTNNINQVLWSYSTAMAYTTDRKTTTTAARTLIKQINNLGTGTTKTNPFTNLTS